MYLKFIEFSLKKMRSGIFQILKCINNSWKIDYGYFKEAREKFLIKILFS